ncbi:MAG TPA: hypothetical protein VF803_03425 [Candidatus Paceibacterota bacterium]
MSLREKAARAAVIVCAVVALPLYAHADQSAAVSSLQAQLNQINAEISALNTNLQSAQNQQSSLERDVSILDDQIKKSQLEIQRRTLTMAQLSKQIQGKEDTIAGLNDKLDNEYESLAAIIRDTDQLDATTLTVAALTATSTSNFFDDYAAFNSIGQSMQDSFTQIQTNKQLNEQQKTDLEAALQEETQLRQVQQLQQQQIQAQEDQKNQILKATKGQEKLYQQLISSKRQTAAQIEAALFELTGTNTKGISFGQALQYANLASQKTGIRPAFLLGLITEESGLGKNVGTGSWYSDMNPTRDVPVFRAITQSLGLDPNTMPVSKRAWYGWGGAMGPAQFIPSTWALYAGYAAPTYTYNPAKDRIGKLTGNKPPNPWNPQDAFMAAAIYLTDSGAGTQTYSGEFRAAMCYLAGCGNVNKADLQFYGNDVMSFAAKYQCQIDIINGKGSGSCASAF